MTPEEQQMIVRSLPLVLQNKGRLRQSFYKHLFAELPEAQALFTGDAAHMNLMFERSLTDIFYACSDHASLQKHVLDFVAVHRLFDFTPAHFDACEAALEEMFADCAAQKEDFDPSILALWQRQARELVARFKAEYEVPDRASETAAE